MSAIIRYILIFTLVYFIYRGIRYLINLFIETSNPDNQFKSQNSVKNPKSSIDKKDIIDAEFEDIDESEKSR